MKKIKAIRAKIKTILNDKTFQFLIKNQTKRKIFLCFPNSFFKKRIKKIEKLPEGL